MGRRKPEEDVSDEALIRAARRRLLAQIGPEAAARAAAPAPSSHDMPGGLMGELGGGGASYAQGDDPFAYMVDIERHNLPPDASGKSPGWTKKVRRYRDDKKKD